MSHVLRRDETCAMFTYKNNLSEFATIFISLVTKLQVARGSLNYCFLSKVLVGNLK
jgi:hypothetical protein